MNYLLPPDFHQRNSASHSVLPEALSQSGVEAKEVIQDGMVTVNGEVDTRRGRKLYPGDTASFDGQEIKIEK